MAAEGTKKIVNDMQALLSEIEQAIEAEGTVSVSAQAQFAELAKLAAAGAATAAQEFGQG